MEVKTEYYKLLAGKEKKDSIDLCFRWNARAGILYEKIAGHKPDADVDTLEDSIMLSYAGTVSGMQYEGQPFDLSYDEYIDLIDDQIEVINELFERMNPAGEGEKKKRK